MPLSDQENNELVRCEQVFADRRRPFYEWGRALAMIKKGKLFRGSQKTFEEYCRQRWHISRFHAYRLIQATEIVCEVLLPLGNIPLPTHESQARPLLRANRKLIPRIWKRAIEDSENNHVAAADVLRAIAKIEPGGDRTRPNQHHSKVSAPLRQTETQPLSESRKPLSTLAKTIVPFTKREEEILTLAGDGMANKEIAVKLSCSKSTIRTHWERIFRKVGAHTRSHVVATFLKQVGLTNG